jgi:hypothetical protein
VISRIEGADSQRSTKSPDEKESSFLTITELILFAAHTVI